MANDDRRGTAEALVALEELIERMEMLGHDAEDAAARITRALGGNVKATSDPDQQQLLSAIGDVIEIVTERSRLAHSAHRVILDLRRREREGLRSRRQDA